MVKRLCSCSFCFILVFTLSFDDASWAVSFCNYILSKIVRISSGSLSITTLLHPTPSQYLPCVKYLYLITLSTPNSFLLAPITHRCLQYLPCWPIYLPATQYTFPLPTIPSQCPLYLPAAPYTSLLPPIPPRCPLYLPAAPNTSPLPPVPPR